MQHFCSDNNKASDQTIEGSEKRESDHRGHTIQSCTYVYVCVIHRSDISDVQDYINTICAGSLPSLEYFPAFLAIHGVLLQIPHYLWLNIYGSSFAYFFSKVRTYVRACAYSGTSLKLVTSEIRVTSLIWTVNSEVPTLSFCVQINLTPL